MTGLVTGLRVKRPEGRPLPYFGSAMYFRSDGRIAGMLVKGQQFSPSSRHWSAISPQQGQTSGRSIMGRFALVSKEFFPFRGFDS